MVEVPCAGLAASRRTEKNMEELEAIIACFDSDKDFSIKELLHLDLQFHLAIADCTQNPLTKTLINAITRSYLKEDLKLWNDKNKKEITAFAEKIVESIKLNDSDSAMEAMEKHLNGFLLIS
ncbi:hypothetical protein AM1BK_33400 [Neobacillus kokaensis]|uniref:GntR C-terminal domain-containing protein n=2 Tax=Neobacillus kokaensis TaxID=2759023 RepID=A0ABQ3N509_9BACI|nr:hypothetical protein AM1BK_33400 [Neobacillus kokaensis]